MMRATALTRRSTRQIDRSLHWPDQAEAVSSAAAPERLWAEDVAHLQRAAGNVAVAALLMRQPQQAATQTDPVAFNRRHRVSKSGLLVQVRAHLRLVDAANLPLINESDDPLAQAVSAYQAERTSLGDPTGMLTGDTLASMRAEGMGTREWGKRLDERDREELRTVKVLAASLRDAVPARRLIVAVAESQIGGVHAWDRGDGFKYGGERLAEYFTATVREVPEGLEEAKRTKEEAARSREEAAYKSMQGKMRGPALKPKEWCGIFATWCVRTATGAGHWSLAAGRPVGWKLSTGRNYRPGDILPVKSTDQHHVLLADVSADGSTLTCIEGNTEMQAVIRKDRPASDALGYYRTVEDGT